MSNIFFNNQKLFSQYILEITRKNHGLRKVDQKLCKSVRREIQKLCLKVMTKHQRFILLNVRIHWIYLTAKWPTMNLIPARTRIRNLEVLLTIFTSIISVRGLMEISDQWWFLKLEWFRWFKTQRPFKRRSKRSTLEIGARTSRLSAVAREVNQVFVILRNFQIIHQF